jgi:hypothetical protein
MRNILLNTWVVIGIMISVLALSLWRAVQTSDALWISRAGSIVTVLGILLTVKHNIFSESRDIESIVKEKNHYAVWAPEEDSDEYRDQVSHARVVLRDEYLGAALTLVGTCIWGYGDLLGALFT